MSGSRAQFCKDAVVLMTTGWVLKEHPVGLLDMENMMEKS